jgi:hypothetical protein
VFNLHIKIKRRNRKRKTDRKRNRKRKTDRKRNGKRDKGRNDPNRSETMQDSVIELRQMNLNCRIADLQKDCTRMENKSENKIKNKIFSNKH